MGATPDEAASVAVLGPPEDETDGIVYAAGVGPSKSGLDLDRSPGRHDRANLGQAKCRKLNRKLPLWRELYGHRDATMILIG